MNHSEQPNNTKERTMTTNDKKALRERLYDALDRLFTAAVREASEDYRAYIK